MESQLITHLTQKGISYLPITDSASLSKISQLFLADQVEEPTSEIEYLYFGIYYQQKKNLTQLVRCYQAAIALGNMQAQNNLGYYLEHQLGRIDWAEQCYHLALAGGNAEAAFNLALIYGRYQRIEEKLKYLHLALERGHLPAINQLSSYYCVHPSLEGFLFGVKYLQLDVINSSNRYFESTTELLTSIPNLHLSPILLRRKIDYYQNLFRAVYSQPTYFRDRCVRDITNLIYELLVN